MSRVAFNPLIRSWKRLQSVTSSSRF